MTPIVSRKAKLGKNVRIGPGTVVFDGVVIGDGTVIDGHCEIGVPAAAAKGPLRIGRDSHIRSHCVFYQGSTFADGLATGHYVLARENCRVGRGFHAGSRCDLEGELSVGDWVRLHSQVHLAQGTRLGDFVYIAPRVMFTNDPFPPSFVTRGATVEDMAVIATAAMLMPGVTVGLGSFVAAGSVVRRDVPDVSCAAGSPAAVFSRLDRFFSPEFGPYHPWTKRFGKRYPPESRAAMKKVAARVDAALRARPR